MGSSTFWSASLPLEGDHGHLIWCSVARLGSDNKREGIHTNHVYCAQ